MQQVFHREWAVKADQGYVEGHLYVFQDGDAFWFKSSVGGPLGNCSARDEARFEGTPNLTLGELAETGDLDRGYFPCVGDGAFQDELCEEFFNANLDLSTYTHKWG